MGKTLKDAQIGVDFRCDAGSANLQDDRRPTGERGPMYLGTRGGGVGLAFQTSKHLKRRAAERQLDLRQQIIGRHGSHLAKQLVELSSPLGWQEIFPGREYLAQLDGISSARIGRNGPSAKLRYQRSTALVVRAVTALIFSVLFSVCRGRHRTGQGCRIRG
jgi:hypothetical protein